MEQEITITITNIVQIIMVSMGFSIIIENLGFIILQLCWTYKDYKKEKENNTK